MPLSPTQIDKLIEEFESVVYAKTLSLTAKTPVDWEKLENAYGLARRNLKTVMELATTTAALTPANAGELEELAKRTDELAGCREAMKQSIIEVAKLETVMEKVATETTDKYAAQELRAALSDSPAASIPGDSMTTDPKAVRPFKGITQEEEIANAQARLGKKQICDECQGSGLVRLAGSAGPSSCWKCKGEGTL